MAIVVGLVVSLNSGPHLTGGTFTLHGTLTIPAPDYLDRGGSCSGANAAAGVSGGDDITIADDDNNGLATGTFTSGVVGPRGCRFAFTVRGVPRGPSRYVAAVGDDVQLDVPASAAGGTVSLTWP